MGISTLDMIHSATYYLDLHSAKSFDKLYIFLTKLLLIYNVQTTNFTFVGKM